MGDLHEDILAIDPSVRYVAVARGQDVRSRSRAALEDGSSETSDRYEELLVNPALVLLARQRGDIDCGGLRYLVVAYGNFHQLVVPLGDGHLSIAFERSVDPGTYLPQIAEVAQGHGNELA